MKPRQQSAPLTPEDQKCWYHALNRLGFGYQSFCHTADRRDADLMFNAQRVRSYTFPVDLPPVTLQSDWNTDIIACGGALWHWRPLNLSHFA